MLAASHVLIGASLASLMPNPVAGLPLALGLHFLGDLLPHWDLRTRHVTRSKLKTIILSLTDVGIGFFIGWWLFGKTVPVPYLIAMMFTAQLPDWLEAPYHIFDWNFPPFSSIKKLQSRLHHKLDLPWGLVWQVLIVAVFLSFSL